MQNDSTAHIFVVDDDECIREAACEMLKTAHYACTCFEDGESCLEAIEGRNCELLITDVKMSGMDGIEVLKAALQKAPWLPVIIMTSYADVPMSVKALKAGAYDFIEKPFSLAELLGIVRLALKQTWFETTTLGKSLTKAERIVLRLLMQGMSNRRIAYVLQRSERTIEVHRGHIMQKLGVDNIVDLVKRASAMGFDQAL